MRTIIQFRSMNRFLGSLFVGYVGLPFVTSKCDDHRCRQRAYLTTLTTYVFPTWLLARAFSIAFRFLPCLGPELLIRVTPVVLNNSVLINFAYSGDVDGVKKILSRDMGSPFDMDCTNGLTALMVC